MAKRPTKKQRTSRATPPSEPALDVSEQALPSFPSPSVVSRAVLKVPDEALKEVFTYCSVPVRCRIRRVCQSWKFLVCLPKISETVIVDDSCIVVRNPVRPVRRSGRIPPGSSTHTNRPPGSPLHSQKDPLQFGWYKVLPYHAKEGQQYSDLRDHRRHGILGPHVRTLIFDGYEDKFNREELVSSFAKLSQMVRSIGYYCTNIRRIVYWRLYFGRYIWPTKADFSLIDPPSGLPVVTELSVKDSLYFAGSVFFPGNEYRFDSSLRTRPGQHYTKRWVDFWDISQRDVPEEERDYSTDDLAWLAKHAIRLPDCYHELIRNGALMFHTSPRPVPHAFKLSKMDLRTMDFIANTDKNLLRVLAYCVQHEQLTGIEPIPRVFDCYRVFPQNLGDFRRPFSDRAEHD